MKTRRRVRLPPMAAVAPVALAALALLLACAGLASAQQKSPAAQRQHSKGDFLADLEWRPGSKDVSYEEDAKPQIFAPDNDIRPPGHVFGVHYTDRSANPRSVGFPDLFRSEAESDAAILGAQLVRAYNEFVNPADAGPSPLLHQYLLFLQHHSAYRKRLQGLFTELDLNADGLLDEAEIAAAVDKGLLSRIGARTIKSWDVNYSQRVSWEEFQLGPMFLVILESNPRILQGFRADVPGNAELVTSLYRDTLGDYLKSHPAALGLIQLDEEVSSSRTHRRRGFLKSVGNALKRGAKAVGGFLKRGARAVGGALKFAGGVALDSVLNRLAAPEPGPLPGMKPHRYQTVWGVPSYDNEACVICQFMYQIAVNDLNKKVVDEYASFDDFPYPKGQAQTGGMVTLDHLATSNSELRARLIQDRGERSPARMMKNVLTKVLQRDCGETAPALYRGICKTIWDKRDLLAYSMYMKESSGPACADAFICNQYTYFNSPIGVHYPTESNLLNNKRGVCGMIGGVNSRANPFLRSNLCFVTNLARVLGFHSSFRFQEQGQEQVQRA